MQWSCTEVKVQLGVSEDRGTGNKEMTLLENTLNIF